MKVICILFSLALFAIYPSNVRADWNEQAIGAAKKSLKYNNYSRDGLIDHLIYKKFTAEQAEYAVSHIMDDGSLEVVVHKKNNTDFGRREDIDDNDNWKHQAKLSAENYIRFMPTSRQGLIDMLISEHFTKKQAIYGVDSAEIDWNEQALKSAENYIRFMPTSRQGLIDMLISEHFTKEQAIYGVDSAEIDWNEQAVKSAENYIRFMPTSKQGLIDMLVSEHFTKEQAIYGVNHMR